MLSGPKNSQAMKRQRGAAAVEFGIIAILFFTLFFGILEFGRFFYLYNTVQEITRCAAREAVVKWKDDWGSIPQQCLFGHDELVAGWEIHGANVRLRALNLTGCLNPTGTEADEAGPHSKGENTSNCTNDPADPNCIRCVEASVRACEDDDEDCQPIRYQPMFGLIPLRVDIPYSTVRMPAESLGY